MTLVLGCDIRVAVPQARFSYPILQSGALPGAQNMERLRATIGPGLTSALLLGGQRILGERALNWGLVATWSEAEHLFSLHYKSRLHFREFARN